MVARGAVFKIDRTVCVVVHECQAAGEPQEFGKPGFVFGLLVKNGKREVVGSMILSGGEIADSGVAPNGTPFRLHQYFQYRFDVCRILRQFCRRSSGDIMEGLHVVGQFPSQFINARDQRFEMIAVFYAGVFRDHLQTFSFHADQVDSENGVVIECGQLCRGIGNQQFKQFIHIRASDLCKRRYGRRKKAVSSLSKRPVPSF